MSSESGTNGPLLMVRACACHDSHGIAWDEEGTVTETYEVTRCAQHADVPSIYEKAIQSPPGPISVPWNDPQCDPRADMRAAEAEWERRSDLEYRGLTEFNRVYQR